MPNVRTFYQSFAGGEMSPELFARLEDAKARSGAATIRNFIVTPQGPVMNRPGFVFVREVKDSTKKVRLLPFTFSPTQTLVIEMGENYFRFHTEGGTVLSGGVPYEVVHPYVEVDLFDVHYAQSNDVLTLVHPNYAPRELKRLGATNWTLSTITFGSALSTPAQPTVTTSLGGVIKIASTDAANEYVNTTTEHGLSVGDSVYISGANNNLIGLPDGYYIVSSVVSTTTIKVQDYNGNPVNISGNTQTGTIQFAPKVFDITNKYVVTAANDETEESNPSPASAVATNNLRVPGSYNRVSLAEAVTGATRYNWFKLNGGIYGFIGQSSELSFTDDNIAPDMAITPPTPEAVFNGAGKYPGAVGYFEQRRIFAGTTNAPQNVWMTRTGTESDLRYAIPIRDSDRIAFQVASRERHTIRHIIPSTSLLMLTDVGEWRVFGAGDSALTPTSVAVRPQSYVGANNVQPAVVNNSVVYCAARGGHVRELGYNWNVQAFLTGDLSLRATHLFDDYEITDMAYSKAPQPVLWFVSTSGRLLGLTYVPEQQVGAWHWHDTQGAFESVTAVTEGEDDAVYVVVKRTINGITKRYVERMARRETVLEDAVFMDSAVSFNGTNTGFRTLSIIPGFLQPLSSWGPDASLRLQSNAAGFFSLAQFTNGDQPVYVLTAADGSRVRFTGTAYVNDMLIEGKVDRTVPEDLRSLATFAWASTVRTMNAAHLTGSGRTWRSSRETLAVLADGAVEAFSTTPGGQVVLSRPAVKVTVGLPYVSDLQTMPLTLQVDGSFGHGRQKNVNKAWVRVYQSSGLFVGPSPAELVEHKQRTTEPPGTPPRVTTGELQVVLTPTWANDGQIYIRQAAPLPLTVVGMALEVAVGG